MISQKIHSKKIEEKINSDNNKELLKNIFIKIKNDIFIIFKDSIESEYKKNQGLDKDKKEEGKDKQEIQEKGKKEVKEGTQRKEKTTKIEAHQSNIFDETKESIKIIFENTKENIDKLQFKNSDFILNSFKEVEEKILSLIKTIEIINNIFEEELNQEKLDSVELKDMEQIKIILNEIKKRIFKKKFLSLLVFDELGLSEKSPTNCLKALHSKLEMSLNPKEQKQISFIGISNWRLDATKMN